MLKSEGLKHLLLKLRDSDSNIQNTILKDIKSRINHMETTDLQLLLEFLNTINDIELEIKLFSLLAICLALDDRHYNTIVTYNQIYEKIEVILSRGLPLKTTTILNFITVLVFTEESNFSVRKKLATHARNMIRVSGCLSVMTTLFVNSMMFPDTWKALCQCLAESCRDCQPNKVHCAHLIPLCVQKCLQGFTDVLTVLQSILCDCTKNIQVFLKSSGTLIFTRELMQYTTCLQVLSTVVQSSKEAVSTIRTTDTPKHVTEILHWNGPHSQKGQWCTIILYYLNSCEKFSDRANKVCDSIDKNNEKIDKLDKETTNTNNNYNQINYGMEKVNSPFEDTYTNAPAADDTTNLFRNVVQEILYWKSKDEANLRIKPFINACMAPQPQPIKNPTRRPLTHELSTFGSIRTIATSTPKPKEFLQNSHGQMADTEINNELSFSFLREQEERTDFRPKFNYCLQKKSSHNKSIVKQYQSKEKATKPKVVSEKSVQTNFGSTVTVIPSLNSDDKSSICSINFLPTVTSTPKRKPSQSTAIPKGTTTKKTQSLFLSKQIERTHQRRIRKTKKKSPVTKLTSRSMSARFLTAINESCTTLVKTVKDVFMPWKNTTTTSEKNNKPDKNSRSTSHSTSFMSFMRKRDAMLGNESVGAGIHYCKAVENNFSIELNEGNPCNTCDNTTMLKQKLENNEYLSKTVKKLKLGVNLYGCNFKKISKTFWPQETYMTPAVLYGLYRKLILK